MKTQERARWTHRLHCKMSSRFYQHYNNRNTKDKAVLHEIHLTLEELWKGCTKKMRIAAKIFDDECKLERTEEKIIKVEIPAGAKDGATVVVPFAGNKKPGIVPGDVIFIIRQRKHAHFTRDANDNLIHKVELTLRDALTGCNVQIPLLCGESLTLSTTDVVSHGTRKTIPGKGMPRLSGESTGDLFVDFSVIFPTILTEEQKDRISSILPG